MRHAHAVRLHGVPLPIVELPNLWVIEIRDLWLGGERGEGEGEQESEGGRWRMRAALCLGRLVALPLPWAATAEAPQLYRCSTTEERDGGQCISHSPAPAGGAAAARSAWAPLASGRRKCTAARAQ